MDDLLKPEELKAINDNMPPEAEYGEAFEAIARAQSAKTKAALVAEGWKSPQDVASIINALTDAFKWNISGEIADARADERARIVGLFDAAYKEWTEDKIENIYEEYQQRQGG
jgi:hypothetical protein